MKEMPSYISCSLLLVVLMCSLCPSADGKDWSPVDELLSDLVDAHSFPGCVAVVASPSEIFYLESLGNFTYGIAPPFSNGTVPTVQKDTLFDLASLTKVLATTSAAMTFYQRGQLDLDMYVADSSLLGPKFGVNGKSAITVRNLLLHNAGFPPDPNPEFWGAGFGCPETSKYHPEENFSCQEKIYEGLLSQTLENPVGEKFVYSDLSMITMMYVVGSLAHNLGYVSWDEVRKDCAATSSPSSYVPAQAQCYYEAYVNKYVLKAAGMPMSGFLPPSSSWGSCMPTWNDTTDGSPGNEAYRHRVIQGQVSDGNSYALGGIAGHAGLFSNARDIYNLVSKIMSGTFVNSTTVQTFTTIHNVTQSSRAYGWDTNSYVANTYRGCGNLSATTYTHTGYTGTQVCNDPEREIITILLTNRVYPVADDASETKIHHARQVFNNLVKTIWDSPAAP